MKKVVFRFDIDTHKCIRDGVPNLLEVSEKYEVPFSFFLNIGQAISLKETIKTILSKKNKKDNTNEIQMMSAIQKLGYAEYVYTALFNPSVTRYEKQLKELLYSNCEVGIHGGRNHAVWQNQALYWDKEKIDDEIEFAIDNIKKIKPEYQPKGFASPAWVHPACLDEVLQEKGFWYSADIHGVGTDSIKVGDKFKNIGVNLLGEPGGVAFFESCRVKKYSTDNIVDCVMEFIEKNDTVVVYDHPYYAGVKEIECISKIIEKIQKEKNINICTLEKLL